MAKFGNSSKKHRETCDFRLKEILDEAIIHYDFSVICGYRSNAEQDKAFNAGFSDLKGGESLHNEFPSKAVDLAPWPIDWKDRERFCVLAGIILGIAAMKGIKIRWGGDWDGDGNIKEHKLQDLPHFEIID